MSGKTNDAAVRISPQYLLALNVHCISHCLNLAMVNSLDEVNLGDMTGVVNHESLFFSAQETVVAT